MERDFAKKKQLTDLEQHEWDKVHALAEAGDKVRQAEVDEIRLVKELTQLKYIPAVWGAGEGPAEEGDEDEAEVEVLDEDEGNEEDEGEGSKKKRLQKETPQASATSLLSGIHVEYSHKTKDQYSTLEPRMGTTILQMCLRQSYHARTILLVADGCRKRSQTGQLRSKCFIGIRDQSLLPVVSAGPVSHDGSCLLPPLLLS
jgi:hypothetical protein